MSNEHTFGNDILDGSYFRSTMAALCEKVAYRLRSANLKGRTIHLKLRYDDFSTITRNKTINRHTYETDIIVKIIMELFEKNYAAGRKIRLVGVGVSADFDGRGRLGAVGVSGFDKSSTEQLSLFDAPVKKIEKLDKLEDLIKKRFGNKAISRAESLKLEKGEKYIREDWKEDE